MIQSQKTDTKLEAFKNAIISEAIADAHSITLDLSLREKELIAKARAEIDADAERYINNKVTSAEAEASRRINARMTENKHTLLLFREECAEEAFKEARTRIAQFTASDEYLPHLKSLLKKALDTLGYGFSAEVLLRAEDMKFADELLSTTSGVSLAFSQGDFHLGGLCICCPAKSMRVDLTFDAALESMVGHFAELTGLKLKD